MQHTAPHHPTARRSPTVNADALVHAIRRAVRREEARTREAAGPGEAARLLAAHATAVGGWMRAFPAADGYELEGLLRSASNTGAYKAGVERAAFDDVARQLDRAGLTKTTAYSRVETQGAVRRITTDGVTTYLRKTGSVYTDGGRNRAKVDIDPLGIRIRVARETSVGADQYDAKKGATTQRWRYRTSYAVPAQPANRLHRRWQGLRVDLTVVKQVDCKTNVSFVTHEVEVERVSDSATVEGFLNALEHLHAWSQNAQSPAAVMLEDERTAAILAHNQLFGNTSTAALSSAHQSRPVSLKLEALLRAAEARWAVTVKLDGVRKFLFVSAAGAYLLGYPASVAKLGPGRPDYAGTLVDGEYLRCPRTQQPIFFAFDLLFYKGRRVTGAPFSERNAYLRAPGFAHDLEGVARAAAAFAVKPFFAGPDPYANIAAALAKERADGYPSDGLIFQPPGSYEGQAYKWKPPHLLTIDFALLAPPAAQAAADEFVPMVGARGGTQIAFPGTPHYPLADARVAVPGGRVDGYPAEGAVVECAWDAAAGRFRPHRGRPDKPYPNALRTAESVWDDINRPITEATIRGNTLAVFRRHSNLVKSRLLGELAAAGAKTVVDIGFGRGGDMAKYARYKYAHVFAVEPSEANIAEYRRRAKERGHAPTRIDVIHAKVQEYAKIRAVVGAAKVDALVAFHSLTFLAQDDETWEDLLAAIDKLLPVGGRFVGMVIDGARMRALIEASSAGAAAGAHERGAVCPACAGAPRLVYEPASGEAYCPRCDALGPVVDNPAFTVYLKTVLEPPDAAESFLGDEIELSIHDPDAIVKAQREWLFYFEPFAAALAGLGFALDQAWFMDRAADRPVFDSLPRDSQRYSELVRVFTFQRVSRSPVPQRPLPAAPPSAGAGDEEVVDLLRRLAGAKPGPGVEAAEAAADNAEASAALAMLHGFVLDRLAKAAPPARNQRERRAAEAARQDLANSMLDALLYSRDDGPALFRALRKMYAAFRAPPRGAPRRERSGRAQSRLRDVQSLLAPFVGKVARYVDVGAGEASITRVFAEFLHARECFAVDTYEPPQLDLGECTFQLIDRNTLPFADSSVDLMTAFASLHHFRALGPMLGEMRRVLKPGATLLIREHDVSSLAVELFLELVHRFFYYVFEEPPEAAPAETVAGASYYGVDAWASTLSENGFSPQEFVLPLAADGRRRYDRFRSFYATFRVDKEEAEAGGESESESERE